MLGFKDIFLPKELRHSEQQYNSLSRIFRHRYSNAPTHKKAILSNLNVSGLFSLCMTGRIRTGAANQSSERRFCGIYVEEFHED